MGVWGLTFEDNRSSHQFKKDRTYFLEELAKVDDATDFPNFEWASKPLMLSPGTLISLFLIASVLPNEKTHTRGSGRQPENLENILM